jgi:hypothetical protein
MENMSDFKQRLVIVLCLLLCCAAWPPFASGRPGGGEEKLQEGDVLVQPLSQQLKNLSVEDKENALIQLEAPEYLSPAVQAEMEEIERLWNIGKFDEAIRRLHDLERRAGRIFAAGIHWKEPKTVFGPDWGTDIPVEVIGNSTETILDFHALSGNLFAVIQRGAGAAPQWTVNFSNVAGGAWAQTYAWFGAGTQDVSATVVGNYLYVGHSTGAGGTVAVARRFFTATGAQDLLYGVLAVWGPVAGVFVQEIALCSNADGLNDTVHYFAILSNNSLEYYSSDLAVVPPAWPGGPTGIGNAVQGLDATFNQGSPTNRFVMASYSDIAGMLRVAIDTPFGWVNPFFDNAPGVTAISAFNDNIMVVYEHTPPGGGGQAIKYQCSNVGGAPWAAGLIAGGGGVGPPPSYHSPDVAARQGGGIAVVYQEQTGVAPNPCWYTHTPYGFPLIWSSPVSYNEMDVNIGTPMALEYLPPLPGSGVPASYGTIWIDPAANNAFFDRLEATLGPLSVDTNSISAAAGGVVNFSLDTSAAHALRNYAILGTTAGTAPGMMLPGGLILPVNWSLLTNLLIAMGWGTGILDGAGCDVNALVFPPLPPAAVGLNMHFAFALYPPFDYTSNAVMIRILP